MGGLRSGRISAPPDPYMALFSVFASGVFEDLGDLKDVGGSASETSKKNHSSLLKLSRKFQK